MSHLGSLLAERTITVDRYYRPLRFTFIIDNDTTFEQLLELVQWCSYSLAGYHTSFFTLDMLPKIHYQRLLKDIDPDRYIPIGEKSREYLKEKFSKNYDYLVYEWDDVKDNDMLRIKLIVKIKEIEYFHGKKVVISDGLKYQLPTLANYGSLSEDDIKELSEYMEIERVDSSQYSYKDLLEFHRYSGMNGLSHRIMSTGIKYKFRCYDPESSRYKTRSLIIIGEYGDLEAFCTYWVIKHRYGLIANVTWLSFDDFITHYEEILENQKTGSGRIENRIGIYSVQYSSIDLQKILNEKIGGTVSPFSLEVIFKDKRYEFLFLEHSFEDFFGYLVTFYGESDKIQIVFSKHSGTIRNEKNPSFYSPENQTRYTMDISIDNLSNIDSNELSARMGLFPETGRLSPLGFTRIIGGWLGRDEDLFYLNLWNMIQSLKAIFSDRNIRIEPSDKGQMAAYFMNLFSDVHELCILSDENIINLVKAMNPFETIAGSTQKKSNEEVAINFNRISQLLRVDLPYINRDYSKSYVRFLLNKKLMKAGTKVQCDNCFNVQWIPIEEVKEEIACSGCFSQISLPKDDYNQINLTYTINDLLGKSIEQGFLSHLFTLHYLLFESATGTDEVFCYYPGLNLYENGTHLGEIDLVLVSGSELICCECKIGRDVEEEEILNMYEICERLNSDVIIFSTLGKFTDICIENIEKYKNKYKIKTVILEKSDLLNQARFRASAKVRYPDESYHQIFTKEMKRVLS